MRIRDADFQGTELKIAYMWVALDPAASRMALVQVAETLDKRSVLAAEIIKGVMLPQFVTLPLAVLLVWLALVRPIKPLNHLEERIRARATRRPEPAGRAAVPLEVAPLVSSGERPAGCA